MNRKSSLIVGGLVVAGGIISWIFPPFHIRPLGGAQSGSDYGLSNNGASSNHATKNEVPRSLESYVNGGVEVSVLWQAFDSDASQAQRMYGHQAGLGGAWYFSARGTGVVDLVEKDRVMLAIEGTPQQVLLDLGVVVDNTVRESLGIKASLFANSQDFNAVSSELNQQVEQNVIAFSRSLLQPGAKVEFVGCAKIASKADLNPLRLIPIHLNVPE